jgi:thioredoxin reductase (NADPH)
MKTSYDVIVLGGGPAGLTAGIYLSRAKKKTLIINEGAMGGQVIMSHMIANYPGVKETSGYILSNTMKKQAVEFGCDIRSNCSITELDLTLEKKIVTIDNSETFEAKAVIIASGGTPRSLGIDSEEKFKGQGISYCATCDGDFFQDQNIVVIGGGNSALEEAVSLTQYARSVTIVHQFDHFQAYEHAVTEAKRNEKIDFIMESEVIDFIGNTELRGVKIKNKKDGTITELNASGVFIFIGYEPNSQLFRDIVNVNEYNEILTDEEMKTSVQGVFAAGDVRKKSYRQITTAVSDGTVAALSAIEYLQ